MKWRIIAIDDAAATPHDLNSGELIGISVLLTHECGEPRDEEINVYWRARQKIQPQVQRAIEDD